MPIKHMSLRQIRKDRRRAVHNQTLRSELKTLKKRWLSLVDANKHDEARQLLPEVMKRFDQAAAKGILHKNTAARVKSRLTQRV